MKKMIRAISSSQVSYFTGPIFPKNLAQNDIPDINILGYNRAETVRKP
jgi:hypothetical protein